jgi:hypothetical protein
MSGDKRHEASVLAAAFGLLDALSFYADPASYFALMVVGDGPCGDFLRDVSPITEYDDQEDYREDGSASYGKRAREAFVEWRRAFDAPPHGDWQSIDTAPDHVQEAASVALMVPGHSRVRIYHGSDGSLYTLWNGGDAGSPATLWCQLPDVPTSSDSQPDGPPSQT